MSEQRRVVESKAIYRGKVFGVRIDRVQENGREHQVDVVEHPGSFAVAALPDNTSMILVRQYRHAAGMELWEIPAGTAEADESCDDGARRELREETGYTAESLELLGALFPTPGFCTERVHIYAARGLHAGLQMLEEDERIEMRQVSFQDAWRMQASGGIVDMKTMVALLWLAGPPVKQVSSKSR